MPRPFCRRRIRGFPSNTYFRPEPISGSAVEEIILTLDELEAIRLADLEGLYHEDAARRMGVSRPTFGRILDSAHKKIAEALVKGKALRIEGGSVEVEVAAPGFGPGPGGFRCRRRGGATMPGRGNFAGGGLGPVGFCVCPKCGYRKPHQPGVPCIEERCPNCDSALIREGSYHDKLIKDKKKGGE